MNMQGLVDADGHFCNIQVNLPGRTHDSKAWDLSDAKVLVEQHFSRSEYVLEGRRMKPYVLGDSAYSGQDHLIKPYLQSSTNTTEKRRFNLRHCRTRQIVEQAFGIPKCRWRLLLKTQEIRKHQILQLLVMTCCTLHNMCVDDRVPFDAAMIDDQAGEYINRHGGFVVDPNYAPNAERNVSMDGIRSSLTQYLARRAAQLGFVEPRLAEHDLRAEQVERGLPAVGRGRLGLKIRRLKSVITG
jgi:hypothetical protein